MNPISLPHLPYFGTLDVGPNGEVFVFGRAIDSELFVVNRSTNARDRLSTPVIDLSVMVDLGGPLIYGIPGINPGGLLGQAWIATDRSSKSNKGNVYVLCSVTNDPGNLANVMFSRSTDGGNTWSASLRINDDSPNQNACHWFGTLSVAPNGRIDACWNDTRHSPANESSELYYSWSEDGGLTWAPNRPLSPPFNHSLGYPMQNKMGDYIAMVSLNEGACIAYTATFNGEQDIYFVRAELPIKATLTLADAVARISWNSSPGVSYCVQALPSLDLPWSVATNVTCVVATNSTASVVVSSVVSDSGHFYRVVRQP